MKRAALRTTDPKAAAMQFLSLLESELLQRVRLGVVRYGEDVTSAGNSRCPADHLPARRTASRVFISLPCRVRPRTSPRHRHFPFLRE
jgi:hypothetical protein